MARAEKFQKEISECTFSPDINYRSRHLINCIFL